MTELATTDTTDSHIVTGSMFPMGTELAVIQANLPEVSDELAENYPALSAEIDLDEMMEAALGEGETLRVADLPVIKVPSADSDVLMVPDRNGTKMPERQGITGIPVAIGMRRSWWETKEITNSPPDCTSRDGKFGVGAFGPESTGNPTGECSRCPMNKRGSAGTGTAAAACREQRLVFLLTGRAIFPYMIVFPPTSLKEFKKRGSELVFNGRVGPARPELGYKPGSNKPYRASSWLTAEVTIGLKKEKNSKGQEYNQLTITQVRELDDDEIEHINNYGRVIDEMIAQQAVELDNMANEAAQGTDPDGQSYAGGSGEAEALDDLDDEMGGTRK